VWAAHKHAATDTMLDSDDVLLLKPARPELAFRMNAGAAATSRDHRPSTVLAGVYQMPAPVDAELLSEFDARVAPILQANGLQIVGVFVTESAPNTFTRLPVREGEHGSALLKGRDRVSESGLRDHCVRPHDASASGTVNAIWIERLRQPADALLPED
jgi:hypothetical protein